MMLSTVVQDLQFALRGFRRDRRFALSALAAITLAVGGATAVFSVVDRSLFRALPYRQGDRLVSVGVVAPVIKAEDWLFAMTYQQWRSAPIVFDSLTSWGGVHDCDRGDELPQRLGCASVDATFLGTLGVAPVLGRDFTAEEDRPGAAPVAILSFSLWQRSFGGDPGIVGKSFTLDGLATRIIGVTPRGFETPTLDPADVLVPQRLKEGTERQRLVRGIGRLRDGVTAESAAAALSPLFERFVEETAPPDFRKSISMRLRIATLRDQQTREYRLAWWMLIGSVTAFVLIACANVANLLLARSSVRRQEFAIRSALGASRGRLVRQTLTESGLLGVVGGAAGCALAFGLLRVLVALAPGGALRLQEASVDLRVLGFALALSLGAALLFGLAPSLDRMRGEALGGNRATGHRQTWLRQILITAQLSVSLVLLTGAGLLLTSLQRLQNAPLGFERERVMTASFTLPQYRYAQAERQWNYFNALEAALRELPGVSATAIADSLPPGDTIRSLPFVALQEPGGANAGITGLVKWRYVTPGYFKALGIPIQRGRGFSDEDRQAEEQPVVLSASLARRLFGADDPVGKHLRERRVVGVVGDIRNAGLGRQDDLEFYVVRRSTPGGIAGSTDMAWPRRGTAIVRSGLDERSAGAALQAAIQQIDPAVPVVVATMESQVERFYVRPRFQTALLAMFAISGLALAGIGLYGLISFMVAERTREIGVRMALGATPRAIARLVVSDGVRWTGVGVVVGIAASAGVSRLMAGLLYEVSAMDLRVFGGAVAVLTGVAVMAAWLPGRRASRIDPMVALRRD